MVSELCPSFSSPSRYRCIFVNRTVSTKPSSDPLRPRAKSAKPKLQKMGSPNLQRLSNPVIHLMHHSISFPKSSIWFCIMRSSGCSPKRRHNNNCLITSQGGSASPTGGSSRTSEPRSVSRRVKTRCLANTSAEHPSATKASTDRTPQCTFSDADWSPLRTTSDRDSTGGISFGENCVQTSILIKLIVFPVREPTVIFSPRLSSEFLMG